MSDSDGRSARTPGPLTIARFLHDHAASERTGIVAIDDRGETRRIGLRSGLVYGIDAGPRAPVWPDAQLRFVLRLRAVPAFQEGATLSAKYAVEPFHPDAGIRQHIDAQDLPPEPLRQRLGSRRVLVPRPPHPSSLSTAEQALVKFLGAPRGVPELLTQGSLSPVKTLRLLVLLDALGALVTEEEAGALRPGGAVALSYELLGLPLHAPLADVKIAYRKRARELHPDSRPDADDAERARLIALFTELHAAYRRILDR